MQALAYEPWAVAQNRKTSYDGDQTYHVPGRGREQVGATLLLLQRVDQRVVVGSVNLNAELRCDLCRVCESDWGNAERAGWQLCATVAGLTRKASSQNELETDLTANTSNISEVLPAS